MAALWALIGLVVGFGLTFGFHYAVLSALGAGQNVTLVVAIITGAISGAYSAVAFGLAVYEARFLSIVGYILDATWSMLNTIAGFIVWIPACIIVGNFVPPNAQSRRSGTFVYTVNPRGGPYGATTIGTVIGGGWCSHEEVHTWQARVFGPLYMPMYVISLFLNFLFRLVTGRLQSITMQSYLRICFEDWAYAGGSIGGDTINWGSWVFWFLLNLLYVGMAVSVVIGFATGAIVMALLALAGLIVYTVIRSFISAPAHSF